jgi:hypothetical protein
VGALVLRAPQSVFPKSSRRHFVVAFDYRAYGHLDCRRRDRLSQMRMAGVDPADLNSGGSEIIHVVGFAGGVVPFLKGMCVKIPTQTSVSSFGQFPDEQLPQADYRKRQHSPKMTLKQNTAASEAKKRASTPIWPLGSRL